MSSPGRRARGSARTGSASAAEGRTSGCHRCRPRKLRGRSRTRWNATSARSTSPGFLTGRASRPTGWPAGRSPRCCDAGPGVPKPDQRNALEVGERVYLREPTSRDAAHIVALNRASRTFHRGWVMPPTDSGAFVTWMRRCRQSNVKCFLVCRLADGAIVGVFTLSQIVLGMFHSAYLGYYAERPHDGQGYMTEGMRLVLRYAFTRMTLHRVEANVQPENAASIALVKRSGFGTLQRLTRLCRVANQHMANALSTDDEATNPLDVDAGLPQCLGRRRDRAGLLLELDRQILELMCHLLTS